MNDSGSPEHSAKVLTVFRSRLRPEAAAEYHDTARRLEDLARTMPGFEEIKAFVADDGERVSLVTFASEPRTMPGATIPSTVPPSSAGRQAFYATYDIAVCAVSHERHFAR